MLFPKITELFDLDHTPVPSLFDGCEYPWEALSKLREFIIELSGKLGDDFYSPCEGVYISKDATVAASASISGPCIIFAGAEIRHCAYIRGSVIIGRNAVVGNSTELKNCLLFDNVQVPHYNYVGDSILGYRSHLGAGAVTSNVKSDKTEVAVAFDGQRIKTGLRKLGAILGDFVEIGCGTVLNPGCIIGRDTNVYPQASVRGFIPAHSIYKDAERIVTKEARN